MLNTLEEKAICENYSSKDEQGYVHCDECPLLFPMAEQPACKAIGRYDPYTDRFLYDLEKQEVGVPTTETIPLSKEDIINGF